MNTDEKDVPEAVPVDLMRQYLGTVRAQPDMSDMVAWAGERDTIWLEAITRRLLWWETEVAPRLAMLEAAQQAMETGWNGAGEYCVHARRATAWKDARAQRAAAQEPGAALREKIHRAITDYSGGSGWVATDAILGLLRDNPAAVREWLDAGTGGG